jgi:hypothetical protein
MDTRFWGPSGWRLLHLISFTYEPAKQKQAVKDLFENLPYVLPCKFCRKSLSEYMELEPLAPALVSKEAFSKWLYTIHNHVNAKLRTQGLLSDPNPSFNTVKKIYEERIAAGCTRTEFEGCDFLFSIAENHPMTKAAKTSTPMPDAPPRSQCKTPAAKNQWNVMHPRERYPYYVKFWKAVGGALPFEEWREAWAHCKPQMRLVKWRHTWIRELYRIRCCIEKELELVNHEKFEDVCKRLQDHKSGCSKAKRARTCRRIRNNSTGGGNKKTRKV